MDGSRLFVDLTTDLLVSGQAVRFKVSGRSMQPAIRDGEMVTVRPTGPREVRLGDIILYRSQGGAIAHRVMAIAEKDGQPVFCLRGDASSSPDAPVAGRLVLGKVVSLERRGRKVSLDTRRAKLVHRLRHVSARLKGWLSSRFAPACAGGGQNP